MHASKSGTPKTDPPEVAVVIDTNVIFSAILYPRSNERRLFDIAEDNGIPVVILDYVEEEARAVLSRSGLNDAIFVDFLDTYSNTVFREIGEITDVEAAAAKKAVRDVKDRPIFVFVYRNVSAGGDYWLITGDTDLHAPQSKDVLNGRVLRAGEFVELIERGNLCKRRV